MSVEDLRTYLARMEAILNSRPLAYRVTNDQPEVINPSHFLIDQSLVVLPELTTSFIKLSANYETVERRFSTF